MIYQYSYPSENREWKVFSNTFKVQKYEIQIEPFLYQLKIDSKFEIIGKFNFPSESLFINYKFPNQTINRIFLENLPREKCSSKYDRYADCHVFRGVGYLNLANDRYFQREITREEKIPFSITFDLDSNNLMNLQKSQHGNSKDTLRYFEFLSNLRNFEIKNSFDYKNSIVIRRRNGENIWKEENLIKKWNITNSKNTSSKTRIRFSLYDNKYLSDQRIQKLFSIHKEDKTNVKIEGLKSSIFINDELGQHTLNLDSNTYSKYVNDKIDIQYDGEIKRLEDKYLETGYTNNPGIFLPWKSNGHLQNEFFLFWKNNAWKIRLINDFSFNKNLVPRANEELEVNIRDKRGNFYGNLKNFKRIQL